MLNISKKELMLKNAEECWKMLKNAEECLRMLIRTEIQC